MLNIYAPINSLGYGIHGQNMIKSLIENGHEINLTQIGPVQQDPFFEIYWREADKNKERFDPNSPSIYIFHDNFSTTAKGNPLLTFSIFETTKPKDESIAALKDGPTTGILVTTQKHKELLSEFITNKPIHVVNEGVDDCLFNTIPIDKFINTGKFTYISVGKKEERKNTSVILNTFMTRMKDKNVALIMHSFNPFAHKVNDHPFTNLNCWSFTNPKKHGFEYKGCNGKAHKFTHKDCDIYFTLPTIQTSMMPSLYHSANVGIQISRGEGWDLPLVELLACGVPTIATDCLGHSEYLGREDVPDIQKDLYVKGMGSEAAIDNIWFKGDQGEWDILDADTFEAMLDKTFLEQDKYTDKSDDLANYMSANYSWSNAVASLIKVIDTYK